MSSNSITAAEIERALHDSYRTSIQDYMYCPDLMKTVITPRKVITDGTIATAKLTLQRDEPMIKTNYVQEDEQSIWTLEVPGVPREEIEVYSVAGTDENAAGGPTIHVVVRGERFNRTLMYNETLGAVKLDLGVLTITIKRPFKRTNIEVG